MERVQRRAQYFSPRENVKKSAIKQDDREKWPRIYEYYSQSNLEEQIEQKHRRKYDGAPPIFTLALTSHLADIGRQQVAAEGHVGRLKRVAQHVLFEEGGQLGGQRHGFVAAARR